MALRMTARLLKASAAAPAEMSGFMGALSKWAHGASGYRQYGLLREDLIMDELPGVKEALSRLPQAVIDERYFRLKRAMQVSGKYSVLPEGQWTTEEQDVSYLKPTLDKVLSEMDEREEYDLKV